MRFKIISLFLVTGFLFGSCTETVEETDVLEAKGGKKYGSEFKFMSTQNITSLYPTFTVTSNSMRLLTQIYEPLLTVDSETGKVSAAVAESFTVSTDAKVYTFKIRKGIKFHKDACFGGKTHELTAEDVKFTLDMACSGLKKNQLSYLLVDRIKGGRDFFNKSKIKLPKSGVAGVKVKGNYTVEVTLTESFVGFEKVLTHRSLGITPKEAYKKYGSNAGKHPVGSGPFALVSWTESKIVLKRNPKYWRKDEFGNRLPFLAKISMTYAKDQRSALLAFGDSKIDLVMELPVEEIEHILGTLQEAILGENVKHKVDSEKSMSMTYVAMANESEEFKDVRVRKAFNLAVDRNQIIDLYLQGEGWAATNGFVPDMKDYPSENVKGHKFNVDKAKSLMREAGYPNGNGFPKLDFYVNSTEGSSIHKTCEAVANQLKANIGVELNIVLVSSAEREKAINSGKAKIWRSGWIADYPDPENFLAMFYSPNITDGSAVNSFKFRNAEFDATLERALLERDLDKRNALYNKCDQIIVDFGAVMPILTDDHIVMINARVRNFNASSMEEMNLTDVFIKEAKN
ncbi:MAG: ABC transporter substrate-binding protein [Candidatus Margulisbacteria bacterium]|nr:ABC transporter substrate-binding protein [Candidatus Margulisiibacteriota bacterium]